MRRPVSTAFVTIAMLATAPGCTPKAKPFLDLAIYAAAAAIYAAVDRDPPVVEREVVVHEPPPGPPVAPAPPLPPADPPPEPRRAHFDPAKARTALRVIDLAPCRSHGVPHGYVHARVTFAPEGNVREVLIDNPPGLPPDAIECVGDRIGAVSIPRFEVGDEMVTRGNWFVP